MTDTVENVWRRVLLHCPQATPFLAKNWVQTAYNRLCGRKAFSWLRGESQFLIDAQRQGTVTATYLSPTITGVTLVFATSDIGRQWRNTSGPPYTIIDVNTILNTATLDEPYGSPSTTSNSTILDAYLTLPYDFGTFIAVLDPANGWQLRTDRTQDELNLWDSKRISTGTPWCIAARKLSTGIAAQQGRVQYELWPYCTSIHRYPYYYYKSPETLADGDYFKGALRERSDVILTGALAEAALWPGPSAEKRNPYFNMQIANTMAAKFEEQANAIEARDEEIYMTWLETTNFARVPFAPIDSTFMRDHDYPDMGQFAGINYV